MSKTTKIMIWIAVGVCIVAAALGVTSATLNSSSSASSAKQTTEQNPF